MMVEFIRFALVAAFAFIWWDSARTKVYKGVNKHGVPYTLTVGNGHWRIVYDPRPAIDKWLAESKGRRSPVRGSRRRMGGGRG